MTIQLAISGWLMVAAIMVVLWLLQLRTRNAGIVDVGWAASIALLAVWYAVMADGWLLRRVLSAALACGWGFRLALHIHRRSHGREEDGRYRQLRLDWQPNVQFRFFLFFQAQALAAAFFSIPFLLAAGNPTPHLSPLEVVAILLGILALCGEAVADRQLDLFKMDPSSRGKTCRRGLWKYSRHPNYFFEWLVWCAFALFALNSPHGYIALLCPALIFYLLFKVTGIPATEAQALRTKGDDYLEYQRTTSVFVPWFPKA